MALDPPHYPIKISLEAAIEEAEREYVTRDRVFRHWIKTGKFGMTRARAEYRQRCQLEIIRLLKAMREGDQEPS